MNYTYPTISDMPYNNPITKIACGVGIVWLGYLAVRSTQVEESSVPRTKHRKGGLINNFLDRSIDEKNRVLGGRDASNPDVPFYSRHNYNRRRLFKGMRGF